MQQSEAAQPTTRADAVVTNAERMNIIVVYVIPRIDDRSIQKLRTSVVNFVEGFLNLPREQES